MFVTLEYETFYFLLGLTAAVGNDLSVKPMFTERDFWTLTSIIAVTVISLKGIVMVYNWK